MLPEVPEDAGQREAFRPKARDSTQPRLTSVRAATTPRAAASRTAETTTVAAIATAEGAEALA